MAAPAFLRAGISGKPRRFNVGVHSILVNFRAFFDEIVFPARGRRFSNEEQARIEVMSREGYSDRSFADLTIDTGDRSFEATLEHLASEVSRILRDT
jgi:hypothetical protein